MLVLIPIVVIAIAVAVVQLGFRLENVMLGGVGILALFYAVSDGRKDKAAKLNEQALIVSTQSKARAGLLDAQQKTAGRLMELLLIHEGTLARKRQQVIYFDDYGSQCTDRWMREVDYFVAKVILIDAEMRRLLAEELEWSSILGREPENDTHSFFGSVVDSHVSALPEALLNTWRTGGEYESFCADQLRAGNWTVANKGGSGDQGVDLLAERDGYRVAVQCKCYSSPVGNAAVQEVIAGKAFEGATHAIVVSNASYTPAARQLASTVGVLLLHHDQLGSLETFLSKPAA